jgi:hypothetical protein
MSESIELSDLSKRFLEAIKRTGKSKYALSKMIDGFSESKLTHIGTGKYEPSKKIMDSFFSVYPDYKNFVLLGDESSTATKTPEQPTAQQGEHLIFPAKPYIDSNYAACSKPAGFSVCVKAEDCETLSIPFFKDYDFSIVASGDSMVNRRDVDKSIKSGDLVACKIVKSRTHVRYGEVYALSTLDGFTIKQVVPSDQENCIKCVSFNTEDNYYPFDLPVEEIYDWAFVVGIARINRW